MCFFIILILRYSAGWKNWNEYSYICMNNYASLAQLVEQLIRNEQVVGSSPIGGSRGFRIAVPIAIGTGLRIVKKSGIRN